MGRNLTRWLIPLPAILFAVFPQTANAEPVAGLNAVGYIVTEIPPTKSDTVYETCGTETENNINRNFNGEPFGTCPVDYFMIHYTGFITIPEHNTIEFWLASDDGGQMNIGGNEWGSWNDRHCTWMASGQLNISAGSQSLDGWFYEHGGNTCYMLAWNINGAGWVIVPDSAFTTTTSPTTTTTLPETTTTTSSTTTLPLETTTTTSTTVPETTTSTTTTSTTTTTTTQVPYPPPQTSTTSTTTTEPEPATTTTTSEPEPETTLEETTTTVPDETVPETTELETTVPETTVPDETVPDETDVPTTTEPLQETTTSTEPEEVDDSSDTTIANEVTTILEQVTTSEEAVEAIVNPIVLATITKEQAEELFESLEVEELTEEQVEAIIEALANAPAKVRQAFEAKIDIFAGTFDNYVPEGSSIPVSQRRSIVAIGAVIATATVTKRRS